VPPPFVLCGPVTERDGALRLSGTAWRRDAARAIIPVLGVPGGCAQPEGSVMQPLLRRVVLTTTATAGIVVLTATSASAHFCYKQDVNPKAAAGMSKSQTWMPLGDIIEFFVPGLCAEGATHLADAFGATTSTLINTSGTMAGGNVKQGKSNPAINHLLFPESDAEFDALIGAAFAVCGT
jgi:hypothetical protein